MEDKNSTVEPLGGSNDEGKGKEKVLDEDLEVRLANLEKTITSVPWEQLAKLTLQWDASKQVKPTPAGPLARGLSRKAVEAPSLYFTDIDDDSDLSDGLYDSDEDECEPSYSRRPSSSIPRIQVVYNPFDKGLRNNVHLARAATAGIRLSERLIWPPIRNARLNKEDREAMKILHTVFSNAEGVIRSSQLLSKDATPETKSAFDLANIFAIDIMRVVLEFRKRVFFRRATDDETLKVFEAFELNHVSREEQEGIIAAMRIVGKKDKMHRGNAPKSNSNPTNPRGGGRGGGYRGRGGGGRGGNKDRVGADASAESKN